MIAFSNISLNYFWTNEKRIKISYTPKDKKQNKNMIPYIEEAEREMYQKKIEIFKQHYPLLFKLLN